MRTFTDTSGHVWKLDFFAPHACEHVYASGAFDASYKLVDLLFKENELPQRNRADRLILVLWAICTPQLMEMDLGFKSFVKRVDSAEVLTAALHALGDAFDDWRQQRAREREGLESPDNGGPISPSLDSKA